MSSFNLTWQFIGILPITISLSNDFEDGTIHVYDIMSIEHVEHIRSIIKDTTLIFVNGGAGLIKNLWSVYSPTLKDN